MEGGEQVGEQGGEAVQFPEELVRIHGFGCGWFGEVSVSVVPGEEAIPEGDECGVEGLAFAQEEEDRPGLFHSLFRWEFGPAVGGGGGLSEEVCVDRLVDMCAQAVQRGAVGGVGDANIDCEEGGEAVDGRSGLAGGLAGGLLIGGGEHGLCESIEHAGEGVDAVGSWEFAGLGGDAVVEVCGPCVGQVAGEFIEAGVNGLGGGASFELSEKCGVLGEGLEGVQAGLEFGVDGWSGVSEGFVRWIERGRWLEGELPDLETELGILDLVEEGGGLGFKSGGAFRECFESGV